MPSAFPWGAFWHPVVGWVCFSSSVEPGQYLLWAQHTLCVLLNLQFFGVLLPSEGRYLLFLLEVSATARLLKASGLAGAAVSSLRCSLLLLSSFSWCRWHFPGVFSGYAGFSFSELTWTFPDHYIKVALFTELFTRLSRVALSVICLP